MPPRQPGRQILRRVFRKNHSPPDPGCRASRNLLDHLGPKPRFLLNARYGFYPRHPGLGSDRRLALRLTPEQNHYKFKGHRFFADRIRIYRGRYDGPNRDSAGVLTIDPAQWDDFIKLFPIGSHGSIEVARGLSFTPPSRCLKKTNSTEPSAPTNLRINVFL
jgi:hypothetical protein